MQPGDAAVWVAAFLAGLMGSGHCFAMCGGIAGGLGAVSAASGGGPAFRRALEFNLARLFSYTMLGAVAGAAVGLAAQLARLQTVGQGLRLVTAGMVALLGLRFLTGWSGLDLFERAGARIWRRVSPWAAKAARRGDGAGRLLLGLCWGLLPCGLVYTVLFTAAASGNALAGAWTMLAFGAGTLPAVLGMTLAAPGLAGLLSDRTFRRVAGLGLIILAAWMVWTVTGMGSASGLVNHAHH